MKFTKQKNKSLRIISMHTIRPLLNEDNLQSFKAIGLKLEKKLHTIKESKGRKMA